MTPPLPKPDSPPGHPRYEIDFIHPFADGNGRMSRLRQSLALASWRAELAWLPVESLISERQSEYYAALGAADRLAEATPFVQFTLNAIRDALEALPPSDQASDPVKSLLRRLPAGEEVHRADAAPRVDAPAGIPEKRSEPGAGRRMDRNDRSRFTAQPGATLPPHLEGSAAETLPLLS
jgi:hypothetical protein